MSCSRRSRYVPIGIIALWCICSLPLKADTTTGITGLATRSAERVAKTHKQHVLVTTVDHCILDSEVCGSLDVATRIALEKLIPGVQLLSRGDLAKSLVRRGFLPVDSFNADVLQELASEGGADILVTESLRWERDRYELSSEIVDTIKRRTIDEFKIKVPRSTPESDEEPLLFRAGPEDSFAVIIAKSDRTNFPVFRYPACATCFVPATRSWTQARVRHLQGDVVLLATITEQGVVTDIAVVKSIDEASSRRAVEAVRTWRFKPAIGVDGNPFATRTPIELVRPPTRPLR
jgi:TonB family protein